MENLNLPKVSNKQNEITKSIKKTVSIFDLHKLPKFRDGDSSEIRKKFVEAIEYCRIASGIQNQITKEEMKILYEFCKSQYKDFAPEEIKKAFNLLNSKKLTENEISHFNAFSCSYIGKVLSEYRKFRRKEINRLESNLKKEEVKPTKEKLQIIRKEYVKTILNLVDYYKKRGQWKFDGQMSLHLINEISRLKFIEWSNYMTGGKINPEIEEQAIKEIKNRIKQKEISLDSRYEVKKLREKLDLHLSGQSVKEIEGEKRAVISEIILKDYLDNNIEEFNDFIDFFENEIG